MGKVRKRIAWALCFILLCLMAGCGGPAQKEDSFTLEDLERSNIHDDIFRQYSSVRAEATFFYGELSNGKIEDFTQTSVFVKGSGGVSLYVDTSFGAAYAVEGRSVFGKSADGKYSVDAFFDDGLYDTYYLPCITKWITYSPTDGEEIVSVSVENGVRKVVTNVRASAAEGFEQWGIPDGTVESNYELDAQTGMLLREIDYLTTDDGQRAIMADVKISYGKDDDFPLPEYVTACKDMTQTRTVHFIRNPGISDEKAFTFTLPKGIDLNPVTLEAYEYFADAECTVPYENANGDYPDELTLYMKKTG